MNHEEMMTLYLANGGKITRVESSKFNSSAKYSKDSQLNALRALKKIVTNETDLLEIDQAISRRIEVLKVTF